MNTELNMLEIVLFFLRNKKKIILNGVLSLVLGILLSLTFTKYYKASVLFTPLTAQSTNVSGLLSMFSSLPTSDVTESYNYSKRLYNTIFQSREIREEMIDTFDLIRVYEMEDQKVNQLGLTLKILNKNIKIEEIEEGGLGMTNVIATSLTIIDRDPQRAADMANWLFRKMEERAVEFGRTESQRRIEYLNAQISEVDDSLVVARDAMKKFQQKYHIYDIEEQIKQVVTAVGALKAEQISLEKERSFSQSQYGTTHPKTKAVNRQLGVVKQKLKRMEYDTVPNFFVGLDNSIELRNQYIDIKTYLETYEQNKVLLAQQLEQHRLKLNRSFSDLYVIDRAVPPPYKFKPKRALIALLFSFVWMSILFVILLLDELKKRMGDVDGSSRYREFHEALKQW